VAPQERGGPLRLPPQQGLAAAQRRRSRLKVPHNSVIIAQAGGSGAGKDAALVTNLQDKGMATGRPPEQAFLRMFS
jgi:hypothetical protein